ncbi:anaerobic nitric oxide reductase flavorubredoxin [Yersinia intermedia]|jgi:anaerobic nitric oxide reductase flavorubredoxin|uniref:Anaerobic nitric oxide reductase flavorubredoxin n=1 Tax=Yersinia intermedia TaxID=631 RepID=A0A209A3W1_YERIN|nr:anaerobic nitric oxide reductase flavorubredoxin [Yersinia intermedia]MCB5311611.1 anaerobic nitric oxide reductase flavorubredoxin [Yersinia intermedia]MCB5320634.1 anaerobic nitric oxide reductase flavorubredoxin [Yersinia intermedia]MCB5325476.1 anaerobic nitric oxide reductase flavorubredoxin [Yersinia intermedia]OVZ87429.1 anaerobic nitric oxide reductase flavorubredoxin [Yersinia intermedia]UNK21471.1 anaerobic nitric oxide reductase flavorubredoxin [Yersinia intermedia]
MAIQVKNNIKWVGQRDWEVRDFHGTEYKTLKGTSYNSYLICEEKNILIDTVDQKFDRDFVANLEQEIDLNALDYIVINHAEEDHAGALTELMARIPNTPIYCTANAIDSINGHHHHPEWNFITVKTGDTLDIGNGKQLIFVETPMLHWPDSMMTYITGDAVLFSNDAFGQHYCDEHLFNDEVDQTELYEQCARYYANILTPFSRLVTPKINEILGFNLPVSMIATSHGVVWRDNPTQIVTQYLAWAADYQEDRVTIFYDTMSNNTRMMADAIAQGIHDTDPGVAVKIYNIARHDKNEILTQVFRSKGVLVGSSTMNNVMMPKIAGMLEELAGLRFRNKKAAAFGSFGWTGGAVDRIQTRLMDAGFDISLSLKMKWRPDTDALAECREHGRKIAREWALHPLETPNLSEVDDVIALSQEKARAENQNLGISMQCSVCQWIYDPALGEPLQEVKPGTCWENVPDFFLCPECGLGKSVFDPL